MRTRTDAMAAIAAERIGDALRLAAALAVGAALGGSVLRFNAMQLMGAVGIAAGIVTGLVGTAIV